MNNIQGILYRSKESFERLSRFISQEKLQWIQEIVIQFYGFHNQAELREKPVKESYFNNLIVGTFIKYKDFFICL
ncbi:UNVERIFIED_CONTAM: hypothetical protein PYX00_002241 [Menopon gallinae]|uniref:Uncharacterized protein n=1 Tax=Menopon gallinae TaxID=328185 RepID=A0AAW2IG93_9NEOP